MSDTNGSSQPEGRILTLDGARKPKDRGSDLATKQDVANMIASECAKVHEHYLTQIPTFVARMIQDALLSYGLIVVQPGMTDIAPGGSGPTGGGAVSDSTDGQGEPVANAEHSAPIVAVSPDATEASTTGAENGPLNGQDRPGSTLSPDGEQA